MIAAVQSLIALIAALSGGASPSLGPAPDRSQVERPTIVQRPIPFGAERKRQMKAYAKRHYGVNTHRLKNPQVIVEHYTVSTTLGSAYNTFASNRADPELGELPGVCAHFIVDRDGMIVQLVPLALMCRHTIGLNHRAIGIEMVGMNAGEILKRKRQRAAMVRLTAWLRCREGIKHNNVIGHAMSLTSPFHEERVARIRTRTHGDWTASELAPIRRELARRSC
jgi:hypothetical protein